MNIAIFTNSYPPHVGGVATSVSNAAKSLKHMGHDVLVVAPSYGGVLGEEDRDYVFRLQSIENISGSSFSMPFPFSTELNEKLEEFCPDIIHSNYPFLVGDMAIRYGARNAIPVVFTHHTRYEAFDGLLPWDIDGLDSLLMELSAGYANLCNHVIVPTNDMVRLLKAGGVKSPISIIPTGLDTAVFSNGDGEGFRKQYGIPPASFVVGYTGRLAPEKNLIFWSEAVSMFLLNTPDTRALVVGGGEMEQDISEIFRKKEVSDRLILTGVLQGQSLIDSYHAMDVLAFASKMETQGLVLIESFAAGCPVVALDVECVRDIISDGKDGRLVGAHDTDAFIEALREFATMSKTRYKAMCRNAVKSARLFSLDRCVKKTLKLYSSLIVKNRPGISEKAGWPVLCRLVAREARLWKNRFRALGGTLLKRQKKQ